MHLHAHRRPRLSLRTAPRPDLPVPILHLSCYLLRHPPLSVSVNRIVCVSIPALDNSILICFCSSLHTPSTTYLSPCLQRCHIHTIGQTTSQARPPSRQYTTKMHPACDPRAGVFKQIKHVCTMRRPLLYFGAQRWVLLPPLFLLLCPCIL
jgi:hypothetical protein